jgi:hypothetical protein
MLLDALQPVSPITRLKHLAHAARQLLQHAAQPGAKQFVVIDE